MKKASHGAEIELRKVIFMCDRAGDALIGVSEEAKKAAYFGFSIDMVRN